MFGPKLNTVFASRWKALSWSFMVLVTAYCTIPHEGEEQAVDPATTAKIAAMVDGGAEKAPAVTGDPWDTAMHHDKAGGTPHTN